jgi:hypothetical protein
MKILDCFEPYFCPETFDDSMLLAWEFGYSSLIASLAPQRHFPMREDNIYDLLRAFGRANRSATVKTDFQFDCDSIAVMQHHKSGVIKVKTLPASPEICR